MFYPFLGTILICLILNFIIPKSSPWPYGHTDDSFENIRTAFWAHGVTFKDIAINHTGVPEIILLASKFVNSYILKWISY